MSHIYPSYAEDLNGPELDVLKSILDSRIEQVDALTLPNDIHRKDIVQAIQKIKSYPKRLSSFLDYLIDYTYHLNLELSQKQDQLQETIDELAILKKFGNSNLNEIKSSDNNQFTNNLYDADNSSFEESINSLKKKKTKQDRNINEDYILALKTINAEEGNLHQSLNLIIQENQKLHEVNNELKSRFERSSYAKLFSENNSSNFDEGAEIDHKVDISELKDQFNQIEFDLVKLKEQVQRKFTLLRPKK